MKFSTTAIVATVAVVASAYQITDLPACAIGCLTGSFSASTCSGPDFACTCTNQEFISTSTACIKSKCTDAEQAKAIAVTDGLCADNGHPLAPASSSAVATTSAAPSTSEAPTTSSEEASTTTSEAAPTSSASAPASYSAPAGSTSTSSVVASTTLSVSKSATATAPASYTTPAKNSTATVPAPPANTNGASAFVASGALAAAGLVAALFI